jgi:hypothetical protein
MYRQTSYRNQDEEFLSALTQRFSSNGFTSLRNLYITGQLELQVIGETWGGGGGAKGPPNIFST